MNRVVPKVTKGPMMRVSIMEKYLASKRVLPNQKTEGVADDRNHPGHGDDDRHVAETRELREHAGKPGGTGACRWRHC